MPCEERDDCDAQHGGHEDRADAVGETLYRRTRSLRFAQQPDDLCQGAVRTTAPFAIVYDARTP